MSASRSLPAARKPVAAPSQSLNGRRDTILVLDFGGQYCHLIARAVREQNVYSEIVGCDTTPGRIGELAKSLNVKGIVLSGGPESVYSENAPPFDKRILDLGVPVLGLCYGHQLIAHLGGGEVRSSSKKEYGDATVTIDAPGALLRGLNPKVRVWMSHGDTVFRVPDRYKVLARTDNTPVAAFEHVTGKRRVYGLQWHPEVIHTENGSLIIRNFVLDICACEQNWKMERLYEKAVGEIRETVKDGRCVVALSGGVDSSVATSLVGQAIGRNLIVVYVDTGLMREGETAQVKDTFGKLGVDLRVIDARSRFLGALAGVVNPEQKRKIIGGMFVKVFEEEASGIDADFLVQGTIYPDRVESGATGRSALIKSHHNVGGLPETMKFKGVIEPLRDLYKDEVRKLAVEVGLPNSIVRRQPFPGPGLAIRIIGAVTEEKVALVRKADHIVTTEIEGAGLADGLWQYFAVLTDTKAVGIKGDGRAYGPVVAWRALVSREAMTAKFAELPWELIRKISTRITNEVPGVTRVVYDTTDKPPGTVEWE